MKRITLALIMCIFLLPPFTTLHGAGIRDAYSSLANIPPQLRQIMDENREKTFPPPHPELESIMAGYFPGFEVEEDERLAEILRQSRIQHNTNNCFTCSTNYFDFYLAHEHLNEEIRFLFDLLRQTYAGYQYFGGDEIFLQRRDRALEKLSGMPEPLHVSVYMRDIIRPALSMINDNHFNIRNIEFDIMSVKLNRITFFPSVQTMIYMSEEFILRNNTNTQDFLTEIDGVTYRVLQVTHNSEQIKGILPSLAQEGELVWFFGLIHESNLDSTLNILGINFPPSSGRNLTVIFENIDTGENHSHSLNLQLVSSPRMSSYPMIEIREVDGITILENRKLIEDSMDELADFAWSSMELRNKPILIMDLRGNIGGKISNPRNWIHFYTEQEKIGTPFFAFSNSLNSQASAELRKFYTSHDDNTEIDDELAEIELTDEHAFSIGQLSNAENFPLHIPISNKNLVIVLTDNNTFSAGEIFVGYLRQLNNVLVIGTNTRGAVLTGGMGRTRLPYSCAEITFGMRLSLRPDLSQFEGVGFIPDLWVPPGESLERVLKFIERYGLVR